MFRDALQPWHLIILVALIAVLFGSKRLPDAARGLGRSMRIFKAEVQEMKEDGKRPAQPSPSPRTEPLEGRVVEGEAGRTSAPVEHRNDL